MRAKRVFGLDLIRAFAIICVLISHTTKFISEKLSMAFSYGFGFLGVEIFFVLSGFLIGSILIKLTTSLGGLSFEKIKSFWIRRWFRTLPNYYLTFILLSIIEVLSRHNYKFLYLSFLIFSQNFITPPPPFFGVSWSLSVEEWFYVAFPILMLSFYYLQKKSKLSFNVVLYAIFFLMLVCLLLRISCVQFHNRGWDDYFRKIVVMRLDAIAVGVLFALLKNKYSLLWVNLKTKMLWVSLSTFTLLYAYYIYNYIFLGVEPFFLKTFFFTFVSLSLALALPFFEQMQHFLNKTVNQIILKFSLYSYSIYLIHGIVIIFVGSEAATHLFHLNGLTKFVLIWIISYVVASYQYNYFEKPLTDLRDRFKNNIP